MSQVHEHLKEQHNNKKKVLKCYCACLAAMIHCVFSYELHLVWRVVSTSCGHNSATLAMKTNTDLSCEAFSKKKKKIASNAVVDPVFR